MILVFNQTIQFAWSLHEFLQIDHFFISLFSNVDRRIVEIFTVKNYKSFKTRAHDVVYLFQWIDDAIFLQNVLNQFRIDIENFRKSNVFQSFLIRFERIVSSFINNSSFSSMFRVQFFVNKFDIFIRFDASTFQFEIFISSRFRRNSNSEIREFIFSSIIFSYSSIINSDFDLNISR